MTITQIRSTTRREKVNNALVGFRDVFDKYKKGAATSDEFKAARLNFGVYSQRQKDLFMVRTKVAAGVLDKETLPGLADATDSYSDGIVHFTTRQDIQFYQVTLDNLTPLLESLNETGIISLGAGGNSIRNVNACDNDESIHEDAVNVIPVAVEVSDYFLGHEFSKGLPRKMKITICGHGKGCAGGLVDDIAAINTVVNGEQGFAIYVGGGQGAMPRFALPLIDFVRPEELNRSILAILKVFNRYGTRINRNRARLKFLIEKFGIEKFRSHYETELANLSDLEPMDIPEGSFDPVDTSSKSVTARIPTGDLTSDQLRRLYKLLDGYPEVRLLITKQADLVFTGLSEGEVGSFVEGLAGIDIRIVEPEKVSRVTSCNGAATCNEGITDSKAFAKRLEELADGLATGSRLRIAVSGCPNACGHHHTADIGLQGSARKINDILVPHYQFYLGGTLVNDGKFGIPVAKIPAKRTIDALKRVIAILDDEKQVGETLHERVLRIGAEKFEEELKEYTTLESPETDRDSYLDFDAEKEFSLEEVGPGECGGAAIDIIDAYFNQARHDLASARRAETPGDSVKDLHKGVIQSARALLVTYGLDPETDEELFKEFDNKIITRGFVPENYRQLLSPPTNGDSICGADATTRLELTEGFLEECLAAYTRINGKANIVDEGAEDLDAPKRLDLTGVKCPFNYIKVKLALEGAPSGSILEALLDDGSPIRNVPMSLANDGHEILSQTKEGDQHLLVIKKG